MDYLNNITGISFSDWLSNLFSMGGIFAVFAIYFFASCSLQKSKRIIDIVVGFLLPIIFVIADAAWRGLVTPEGWEFFLIVGFLLTSLFFLSKKRYALGFSIIVGTITMFILINLFAGRLAIG